MSQAEAASSSSAAVSYAQLRMEKLKRNQEVLANMGLVDTANKLKQAAEVKPKSTTVRVTNRKRATAMDVEQPGPRRRSPRLSGEAPKKTAEETNGDEAESESSEEEEVKYAFDASKVVQYTCTDTGNTARNLHNVTTVRPIGGQVADPQLKRIYSMNFHSAKPVIAAGGHGGRVSVFSCTLDQRKEDEMLLSFKASKGWVSGVRFFDALDCGLLVSSNDGTVSLWDCTVQHDMMPKSVAGPFTPHGGSGIFDMDLFGKSLITASKDGSLCVSSIGDDLRFAVAKRIEGAHEGVTKSVMFQPSSAGNVVVSGGNDSAVRVWDLRQNGNKAAVEMQSSFGLVVNIVRWNPSVTHQILSASFATAMELHDIRHPLSSPFKLQGHVPLGCNRVQNIYQPVFLNNGQRILASAGGSKNLTMFDSLSGDVLSSGVVGWESGALEPSLDSSRVAVSHGMDISFFECA